MDKQAYKQLVADLMREESLIKDELSLALQELGEIYSAVDNEPNNMMLGKKVRQLIWENTENE